MKNFCLILRLFVGAGLIFVAVSGCASPITKHTFSHDKEGQVVFPHLDFRSYYALDMLEFIEEESDKYMASQDRVNFYIQRDEYDEKNLVSLTEFLNRARSGKETRAFEVAPMNYAATNATLPMILSSIKQATGIWFRRIGRTIVIIDFRFMHSSTPPALDMMSKIKVGGIKQRDLDYMGCLALIGQRLRESNTSVLLWLECPPSTLDGTSLLTNSIFNARLLDARVPEYDWSNDIKRDLQQLDLRQFIWIVCRYYGASFGIADRGYDVKVALDIDFGHNYGPTDSEEEWDKMARRALRRREAAH